MSRSKPVMSKNHTNPPMEEPSNPNYLSPILNQFQGELITSFNNSMSQNK